MFLKSINHIFDYISEDDYLKFNPPLVLDFEINKIKYENIEVRSLAKNLIEVRLEKRFEVLSAFNFFIEDEGFFKIVFEGEV